MGFWKNVDEQLKYLGKSRKELAREVGFDVSYISKGIERDGIPLADLGLRISKNLNVSLEYLLGTDSSPDSKNQNSNKQAEANEIRLYRKYNKLIDFAEKLTDDDLKILEKLFLAIQEGKTF